MKGFGVDADIENNRLLLWANEAEMERVAGLAGQAGRDSRTASRMCGECASCSRASSMPTAQLLEQIREAWSASGNNELIIKLPPKVGTRTQKEAREERSRKTKTGGGSRSRQGSRRRSTHRLDDSRAIRAARIRSKPIRCRAFQR